MILAGVSGMFMPFKAQNVAAQKYYAFSYKTE